MIIPFLNYAGQCAEAIEFYENIFKIEDKNVAYFKDMPVNPNGSFPKEMDNYVLHAEMKIEGSTIWMGDMPEGVNAGDVVSLSVVFDTPEKVQETFAKLKVGGTVFCDVAPTFYSPMFGTVKDKFGVIWHTICRA